MDQFLGPDEISLRNEVRCFLAEHLDPSLREKALRGERLQKDDEIAWERKLQARGWLAASWPREYGGPGWSLIQRYVFEREMGLGGAPRLEPFGISMVGPVVYTYGSEHQKRKYLPRILNSEDWWCQGFSEPGAGSDLASLRTRAADCGDHYRVTGQKIWTTYAHYANRMFCLARTSDEPKRQQGISFLLLDMHAPGVTVRPIKTIDLGHTVNEVFLDEVVVSKEDVVGEPGRGWTYAKFVLEHERNFCAGVARSQLKSRLIREVASRPCNGGPPLLADNLFRHRLSEIDAGLRALEGCELRYLADHMAGRGTAAQASLLKIKGTELRQALSEIHVEMLGLYALPYEGKGRLAAETSGMVGPAHRHGVVAEYLYGRSSTILGGTNEIQRNIIARTALSM